MSKLLIIEGITWSEAILKEKLASDQRIALKGLLRIYEGQTDGEKAMHGAVYDNGIGFNATDAEILTSLAQRVLANKPLTEKQMAVVYKTMPKYAGQIFRYMKAKYKS